MCFDVNQLLLVLKQYMYVYNLYRHPIDVVTLTVVWKIFVVEIESSIGLCEIENFT